MTISFDISFHQKPRTIIDTEVAIVYENNTLSNGGQELDKLYNGLIAASLERQKKFTGKKGQTITITTAPDHRAARILLIGGGTPDETLAANDYEELGGKLYAALDSAGAEDINFMAENEAMAVGMATGLALRSYKFDKYKSKTAEESHAPKSIAIVTDSTKKAKAAYDINKHQIEGVFFARDLGNEPANVLYPDSCAKIIRDELKPLGVEVEIFDEKKLEKLGFGALLAVAQGAANPARLVIMRWNGTGKKDGKSVPLALVGKGVTFDTGGVNLKPGGEFLNIMKMDMGGSAAVVGAMKSLALRKAKTDVVGIVGLVENRLSDRCYLPGDVIKTLAGKTIEIHNTDAEGRLVLADAMTYVQNTYNPDMVIDIATLTGAVLAVFGTEYAGGFANDDDLWDGLAAASTASVEKLWRLPLDNAYFEAMKNDLTDLSNMGKMSPHASSCTAAAFLQHFVDEGRKWAHLDIAGTAWTKTDRPTAPKLMTGYGARLLDRFVAETLEK